MLFYKIQPQLADPCHYFYLLLPPRWMYFQPDIPQFMPQETDR
jgi:hypothetical protein